MQRLSRLPLTLVECHSSTPEVFKHLFRDHVECCDLVTDRQRRAYAPGRKQHALTGFYAERRTSALFDALKANHVYAAGGWEWTFNTAATFYQN